MIGWRECLAYVVTMLLLVGVFTGQWAIACSDGNCHGPAAAVTAP